MTPMRTNQSLECRNLIVKIKRLPLNKWSKVDPSSNQRNIALQEQCTNNLFKTDSRKPLQIPKIIKKGNNLKRTQPERTIQSISSNVPRGCKPFTVKLQRINQKSLQNKNTARVAGLIQNTIEKKMRTRSSIKKGISANTSNGCKESANSLNVNMKQNGLILSKKPIFKGNVNIENLVLTPEHRKSLNKLSLSKNSGERIKIYQNSTKNLDISKFSPVKNSTKFEVDECTHSDGEREPDLPLSNSKGEKIPRNVINNSDLIEQLIRSNKDYEMEHIQHKHKMSGSNSKDKDILKSVPNNPNELKQLICSNEESEVGYKQHENGMRTSNSKGAKIPRNLTNKPDVLQQLICSNEDSEEESVTIGCKPSRNNNAANKFFQRLPKKKLRSRKIVTEPDNIFEFLSQSNTSESDFAKNRDPAEDIIKKLISEGKVRVATNQKGTGRPILKRERLKTGRKKQEANKNKVSKEKGNQNNNAVNKRLPKIVEKLDNCVDGTLLHPPSNIMVGNEDQQQNFLTNDNKTSDEHIRDEGFSLLARSVLLQETRKAGNTHKTNISEQRRLLEVARKFVSTPAASRQTNPLPTADLSPIKFLSPQNRPMCPSPWRINDDSHLPSVFNFTKNKSYLPTFSSDYIPSSPNKNKANTNSNVCIDSNVVSPKSISTGRDNCSNVSRNTASSASNGQLQTSQESQNDSNVENMPPRALTVPNTDDNAAIFNLRQLPNPRRALGKRSPLKVINIIEVVSLPPWKKTANDEVDKTVDTSVVGDITKNDKSNDEDLFGFEEFLDHNSDEDVEINKTNVKLPNRQSIKLNLHRKLKDIQNWRPKNTTQGNTCVSQKACEVFENNGPKQRLINEMICSTMINMKNDKLNAQNHFENCDEVSLSDTAECNGQPPETDFFNDYEPETTFDKKKTLRTYVRPAKRKRKARKHFVMFHDREESTSDTEEEQLEQRKDGKKKRRHEANDNAMANSEIEAFANEFNSMCKDVENYELIVE
ncbi:protein dalmatian isoform X1 [Zeugodacus cucurbitae]|uniref:Protein dalmatian n=1 Tax=Zeugodacus cucurbitae TaxID=28588 RepID=A0A0A1WL09_ZEUCU|nr:protein dalmatian isoform X1 [Zeugodacus cucurbitae]XP_028896091.2 protein dalmatian isoform X1 [Zeugodacus cucurbitae]